MGSPTSAENGDRDETLQRVTIVTGVWMDAAEVTNLSFQEFVRDQPSWSRSRVDPRVHSGSYLKDWVGDEPPLGRADYPVTYVSWLAARAYCQWAEKRLPTEAEWEYAARAGTSTAYWWGDTFDESRANEDRNASGPVGKARHTNAWGLADITGNVWEWTSSAYQPYPYRADDGREDPNKGGDVPRVLRGGSWVDAPRILRSANRLSFDPRGADVNIGFRCARSGS